MSLRIAAQDMDSLRKNIRAYLEEASLPKEKQKILLAGGKVVRNAIKRGSYFKNSKKPNFYYSKQGRITILPGNLRKSIYVFKTQNGSVEVGPRVLRKIAGVYDKIGDKPKSSSGFYAAMLFKSASNFRRQVVEAAMQASISKIDTSMQKTLERLHRRWQKKYGL